MTSFKITFINELSGLREIIDIPDDKYIQKFSSFLMEIYSDLALASPVFLIVNPLIQVTFVA